MSGYLKDPEYKLVENFVRQVYKLPTEITEINVENFESKHTDTNEPQEER